MKYMNFDINLNTSLFFYISQSDFSCQEHNGDMLFLFPCLNFDINLFRDYFFFTALYSSSTYFFIKILREYICDISILLQKF